jgi:hypothetical protein
MTRVFIPLRLRTLSDDVLSSLEAALRRAVARAPDFHSAPAHRPQARFRNTAQTRSAAPRRAVALDPDHLSPPAHPATGPRFSSAPQTRSTAPGRATVSDPDPLPNVTAPAPVNEMHLAMLCGQHAPHSVASAHQSAPAPHGPLPARPRPHTLHPQTPEPLPGSQTT